MKQYTSPAVVEFGDVQTLTAADFTNSSTDVIFFNGVPVGTANGSLDACTSDNPENPNQGDCDVDTMP